MRSLKTVIMLSIVIFLSACAPQINTTRTLEPIEKLYKTDSDTTILFHSVLYYPSEISMNFPGFIVGIEKSPVDNITHSKKEVITKEIPGSGLSEKSAQNMLIDKKLMYISHIVENFGDKYGSNNCAHYNLYAATDNNSIKFCDPSKINNEKSKYFIDPQNAYGNSWEAIDILKKEVRSRLLKSQNKNQYTHVLAITMGWNTDQEEAVRNFNSIVKNIHNAAPENKFNPLVIGITWPSLWKNFKGASFGVKANDADEIGLSWLGAILHESLNDLPLNIPLVVIGHSFGARATSVGACIGNAISRNNTELTRNNIDLLINLQGAYSINRFYPEKGFKKIKYPNKCINVKNIILTSSVNDTAMDTAFFAPMVGDEKSFNEYCTSENNALFDCRQANSDGSSNITQESSHHITYINADNLISFNAYLSGGNAHSDIYRAEMGTLLWEIINHKAK